MPLFLVTFTVPSGLRRFVRQHQRDRWRKMTIDAFEFIRRFLQHVLPSGFPKVRHYGFLSPNSGMSIDAVRWLVTLHYWLTYRLAGNAPHL